MGLLEGKVTRDLKEWVMTEYFDTKVEQVKEYWSLLFCNSVKIHLRMFEQRYPEWVGNSHLRSLRYI